MGAQRRWLQELRDQIGGSKGLKTGTLGLWKEGAGVQGSHLPSPSFWNSATYLAKISFCRLSIQNSSLTKSSPGRKDEAERSPPPLQV